MPARAAQTVLLRLITVIVLALLTACDEPSESGDDTAVLQGSTFGTFYQITLPGDWSEEEQATLQEGAEQVLDEVDASMSTYRDDSEVNRLSRTPPGEWVDVSEPIFTVLAISQEVAEATDGAMDVTVGALVRRWGFGPDQRPERIPSDDELREELAAAGHTGLELDTERLAARRQAGFELDVAATAKGYGIDAVARFLEDQGVERYLVNIGGDMRAGGRYSDERAWRVGIQQPDGQAHDTTQALSLENMAIATSGDYRNYFEEDGQRYSHLIDPRTGRPIEHQLASATVLHPVAARADAFATGLMVLGAEDAMAVAEAEGLKVLLIVRDGDGFMTRKSPALSAYLEDTATDQ